MKKRFEAAKTSLVHLHILPLFRLSYSSSLRILIKKKNCFSFTEIARELKQCRCTATPELWWISKQKKKFSFEKKSNEPKLNKKLMLNRKELHMNSFFDNVLFRETVNKLLLCSPIQQLVLTIFLPPRFYVKSSFENV